MTFKKDRYSNKVASLSLHDDDSSLWTNFRKGSEEAFEALYYRHADNLYNYGMHFFMDKVLVEDSIQDLFLDLWRRREFLNETDSVRFYLCKSLKRNILRKLQAKERIDKQRGLLWILEDRQTPSPEAEVITLECSTTRSEWLASAIRFLPTRQREIIVYRFYQDLTLAEIAQLMSLGIDSTYTLLSRALNSLRKSIREAPRMNFIFGPLLSFPFLP